MSKLTLQQLDAGIDAALANAHSLIEEAKLLLQSGFHARAYTLSHIAREELAKVIPAPGVFGMEDIGRFGV